MAFSPMVNKSLVSKLPDPPRSLRAASHIKRINTAGHQPLTSTCLASGLPTSRRFLLFTNADPHRGLDVGSGKGRQDLQIKGTGKSAEGEQEDWEKGPGCRGWWEIQQQKASTRGSLLEPIGAQGLSHRIAAQPVSGHLLGPGGTVHWGASWILGLHPFPQLQHKLFQWGPSDLVATATGLQLEWRSQ